MASSNAPEVKPPTLQVDAAVFGATVQLPAFDKVEAETWFAVADANFALRKVTDPTTKYYYVLSKLDASTLRKLSAFIKRPKGSDPYEEIKGMLCEAYEPPFEQKLDALLTLTNLGDENPKELGLEVQRLASDATLDDVLKRIYVRCLPQQILTAIASSLDGKLNTVIAAAYKAWTSAKASGAAAASVSAVSSANAGQFKSTASGSWRGGRGAGQRGSRNSGPATTTMTLCNFHKRFGDGARKCVPACSRWSEYRSRDSQAPKVFQVEEVLDGEDTGVDIESGNP